MMFNSGLWLNLILDSVKLNSGLLMNSGLRFFSRSAGNSPELIFRKYTPLPDLNRLAKHDWFDLKSSCFQQVTTFIRQVTTFIRQYVYYLGFFMNLASDLEHEGQCLDRKSANENWRHQFSIWERQKLNIASTRVQVLPLINFERLELDLKNKSINCDLTWIIFWWLVTWLYCLPCILLVIWLGKKLVICDLTFFENF